MPMFTEADTCDTEANDVSEYYNTDDQIIV